MNCPAALRPSTLPSSSSSMRGRMTDISSSSCVGPTDLCYVFYLFIYIYRHLCFFRPRHLGSHRLADNGPRLAVGGCCFRTLGKVRASSCRHLGHPLFNPVRLLCVCARVPPLSSPLSSSFFLPPLCWAIYVWLAGWLAQCRCLL